MPIYMDRHDVSKEVTAEMVADLHQQDLKIQHIYNCKGLTYWFDRERSTAFCLVDAPNKAAIQEMHFHAHGEVPNRIIEVDSAVVESFLGRIEDPQKSQKKELNIINDPAFRTIMAIFLTPSSLRGHRVKSENAELSSFITGSFYTYSGRIVKQSVNHFLVSFDSVTKAVSCALELQRNFEKVSFSQNSPLPDLKIGLSAGVPIDEKNGFFEDTVRAACIYAGLVKGTVILSSEVRDLYESENLNIPLASEEIVVLNPSEDKFLKLLAGFTEKEWNTTTLQAEGFSRHLGFSKSRFYRKLLALTGKSPNSFLKDYRLGKALELLNKESLNISEVAFETGFNSPGYFSKCFQEHFGILPSEYLRSDIS